jgi:hypothetical protein
LAGSFFVSFVYVVLNIEVVHVFLINPDYQNIDDQAALGRHVKTEGKADEADAVELCGKPAHDEGGNEPDAEQYCGDSEILVPVFLLFLSKLQYFSPLFPSTVITCKPPNLSVATAATRFSLQ